MNKKHIVFFMPSLSGGGAEQVTFNLIKQMNTEKYNVTALLFRRSLEDKKEKKNLKDLSNQINIIELEGSRLREVFFELILKLRELKPDIIFSSLAYLNMTLVILKKLRVTSSLLAIREANMPEMNISHSSYPRIMKTLYKWSYPCVDLVIVSSSMMKKEFLSFCNIEKENIKIMMNPVDSDYLRSKADDRILFNNKGLRLIASGSLTYQKGFDRLIRWFKELDLSEASLNILGDGPERDNLRNLIKHLKLESQVSLLGYKKNPWKWVAGSDILILSSRWEGMPNVALESLALGVPVVSSSESGGLVELSVKDYKSIFIYKTFEDLKSFLSKYTPIRTGELKQSLLGKEFDQKEIYYLFEKNIDNLFIK
tara:strand:+ start:595 stop:1701 length:1107 start_codon:yes stop_codon:yes gene_type:complete